MHPATLAKFQSFEGMRWAGKTPTFATVANAFNECRRGYRLYFVAWWGTPAEPAPAGFTLFQWDETTEQPQTDDGREYFTILADNEPRPPKQMTLHRDDVVLVFVATDDNK